MRVNSINCGAITIAALFCAFGLTGARPAKAAPVAVSVGLSELTGSAGDFTSRDGWRAAVDIGIPVSPVWPGGSPSLDVDYDAHSGDGAHLNTLGVYLADRYGFNPAHISPVSPYIGAGIGGADIQSAKNGSNETRTDFSAKVIAGLNFRPGTFAEVSYAWNVNVFGGNANTLDFSVGEKF